MLPVPSNTAPSKKSPQHPQLPGQRTDHITRRVNHDADNIHVPFVVRNPHPPYDILPVLVQHLIQLFRISPSDRPQYRSRQLLILSPCFSLISSCLSVQIFLSNRYHFKYLSKNHAAILSCKIFHPQAPLFPAPPFYRANGSKEPAQTRTPSISKGYTNLHESLPFPSRPVSNVSIAFHHFQHRRNTRLFLFHSFLKGIYCLANRNT